MKLADYIQLHTVDDMNRYTIKTLDEYSFGVKVVNDTSDITQMATELFQYDWMKRFGFTGNSATYYFRTGEDATMFKLKLNVCL